MTLNDLLNIPYLANGRQPDGADCYGLARLARVYLFGKPWMPEHGAVKGADKRAMTKAAQEEAANFQVCQPHPGSLAFCYRGRLCTHIAIVVEIDGRPMILETDEPGRGRHGPRLVSIKSLKQRFLRVVFYDD